MTFPEAAASITRREGKGIFLFSLLFGIAALLSLTQTHHGEGLAISLASVPSAAQFKQPVKAWNHMQPMWRPRSIQPPQAWGGREEKEEETSVLDVRRVTKVTKGGKTLSFRASTVVGNRKGKVGVGIAAASDVAAAVQKAESRAKKAMIDVPMTDIKSLPFRTKGQQGAAKVILRPAYEGTGVMAGGATRVVLDLAGIENALGKILGTNNAHANALATINAIENGKDSKAKDETAELINKYLARPWPPQ